MSRFVWTNKCVCMQISVCVCFTDLVGTPVFCFSFLSPHNVNHKVKVMVSLKEIKLNLKFFCVFVKLLLSFH